MAGSGIPFHGIPAGVPERAADSIRAAANMTLRDDTRALFMKAVAALRAAGAEVVISDSILPPQFAKLASRVSTYAYMRDGTNRFLATFGPDAYHSATQYEQVVGAPLFVSSIGVEDRGIHQVVRTTVEVVEGVCAHGNSGWGECAANRL